MNKEHPAFPGLESGELKSYSKSSSFGCLGNKLCGDLKMAFEENISINI
jgi:hypothetical protein